jgi:hypothetical protein
LKPGRHAFHEQKIIALQLGLSFYKISACFFTAPPFNQPFPGEGVDLVFKGFDRPIVKQAGCLPGLNSGILENHIQKGF